MHANSISKNEQSRPISAYEVVIKEIKALTYDERYRLCEIYLKYYDACNEYRFFSDLDDKDEVLIVYYRDRIVGFTTFELYPHHWQGEQVTIVYSGDTIVEKEHWGQQVLAFRWIGHMGDIKRRTGNRLFWFLIVKGHRTYRYLPTFAKSFYPHWSISQPDLKSLADELAAQKFGDQYNPETGVIEFQESHGHLKKVISAPTDEELKKNAVQYFLECNPEYLRGHELVCICELGEHNLKPLARRIFSKQKNDKRLETITSTA